MPTISDTAVCLRRWDFSETSQTASLFTRKHGLVRGLAKGAKRERGAFSGGFDILTRGQVVAIIKPGRELATVTEWHLEETFRVLRLRLGANRVGLYMADLIHHMLTDQDPHERLFDALVDALRNLADDPAAARSLLRLQWALLNETGFRPELDRDVETRQPLPTEAAALAFSARAGGVVADTEGPDRWRVRPATVEALRRVAEGDGLGKCDGATVARANRLLAVYCRELIGSELPTLRWVFDDLGVV